MNEQRFFNNYIEILEMLEDYFNDGFRRTKSSDKEEVKETTQTKSVIYEVNKEDGYVEQSERVEVLSRIEQEVKKCRRCELSLNRTHSVPGEGVLDPLVMIIGEGPGAEEDATGRPFVGRAGKYLDKWLNAIGLSREKNCFIGNIVKCRPPGNRDPRPEESSACLPFLIKQIEVLKPATILTVGRISSQILTGSSKGIGALRGRVYNYKEIPLVTTYHPSGVLRNPRLRPYVWEDLKLLKKIIDNHE